MNTWKLSGALTTYSNTNVREATSKSPLTSEDTFQEQVVQQGILPTGNDYYDVSLGTIDTASMMELRIDIPLTVRLNGSAVFENCSRLLMQAEVTSLEIMKDATETPGFYAQFFA